MDSDTKELLNILIANENRLVDDIRKLTTTVDSFIASTDSYVKSADAYVKASNERMGLVEKQLDALVRALTTKPTNGKAQ
jgi:hypothetical protein